MADDIEISLKDVIKNVAGIFHLEEWNHSYLKFEQIGQNFFGILLPLELTGKKYGDAKTFRLVLKMAPTDERYRVSGAVTAMFAREIFTYTKLIEAYKASEQVRSLPTYLVPSCYYVRTDYCREVLVLQDMTAEGFMPYTNSLFLDHGHTIVSLKSLAIFHAHSFILRKMNVQLYNEAAVTCVPLSIQSNKRYMDVLDDRLGKTIRNFEGTPYVSLFKNLKDNCVKLIEVAWELVEDTCICHGDIWKENILFKYERNEPVAACLIDYQTTRVSSPAFDVLYLVTSSVDAGVRRAHLHNFLDTYYEHFEHVLAQAGLVSRDVYSRAAFESDLKTVAPGCFIVANTALWLASGCQQEGHVRSKRVLSTEAERLTAIESYKNVMKDIIHDYYSYGYFV